ncbi:uncharacterized protein J3R85_016878 [Psidium guajava]|nr:uncharacterized protein J3R85_016878 [Psidium guajava]
MRKMKLLSSSAAFALVLLLLLGMWLQTNEAGRVPTEGREGDDGAGARAKYRLTGFLSRQILQKDTSPPPGNGDSYSPNGQPTLPVTGHQ